MVPVGNTGFACMLLVFLVVFNDVEGKKGDIPRGQAKKYDSYVCTSNPEYAPENSELVPKGKRRPENADLRPETGLPQDGVCFQVFGGSSPSSNTPVGGILGIKPCTNCGCTSPRVCRIYRRFQLIKCCPLYYYGKRLRCPQDCPTA